MRKIFLFFVLIVGVVASAQESATKQLFALTDIVKNSDNPLKRDSAIAEMSKLYDTLPDFEKPIALQLIKVSKDLNNEKRYMVPAMSISELSKDDLKGFRVNNDKFKETTFIHYKKWGFDNRLKPYIAIKNNNLRLRIVTNYEAKDWIFMDKAQFIVDGEKYEYNVNPEREVYTGSISERDDQVADDYLINLLYKIANSKSKVEIRLSGKKQYDSYIPDGTKGHIGKILDLYEKLKK